MSQSPFKFLDSYTKDDREIFFGREREVEELYHRVFEGKIMLVYGVSGTGKSSLIHCGLANKFQDSDWLPINVRRAGDMVRSMAFAINQAAITPMEGEISTPAQFKKAVRSLYLDHYKPVFFIFDQFEELFIFGNREEKKAFIQIVKSLTESDLQCRFMFVLREEYLAGITEFEKVIPTILANRVRIERMTLANAKQVIEGPCKVFNIEVEEGFADEMLEKLSPGSAEVELTYLQVYLDKVYRTATPVIATPSETRGKQSVDGKKIASHSALAMTFTKDILKKLGDVKDLLGSFLDEQIELLPDPDSALAVLKSFVSVKGTKRQMSPEEVQDYAQTLGKQLNESALQELLQTLIQLRILRDKDQNNRYELRHDALATKIYEKITLVEKELLEIRQLIENAYSSWEKRGVLMSAEDLGYIAPYENRLFLSKNFEEFIEKSKYALVKAKKRRRTIAFAAMAALLVVFAGFTWWAMRERERAGEELVKSNHNLGLIYLEKAENAIENRELNAIRLYSLYANKFLNDNELKEKAVSNIISFPYFPVEFTIPLNNIHENSITEVIFSSDNKYLFTSSEDKTIKMWDAETGNLVNTFVGHKNGVYCIDVYEDFLISGAYDRTTILWNTKTAKEINRFEFDERIKSLQLIPKSNLFIGLTDSSLQIIDYRKQSCLHEIKKVNDYSYSNTNQIYYSEKKVKGIFKFDIKSKETSKVENIVSEEFVDGIGICNNSDRILISVIDPIRRYYVCKIFNINTFEYLYSFDCKGYQINDGVGLITILNDENIWNVIDLNSFKEVYAFEEGEYNGFTFQNNGKAFAGFIMNSLTIQKINPSAESIKTSNVIPNRTSNYHFEISNDNTLLLMWDYTRLFIYSLIEKRFIGNIVCKTLCFDHDKTLIVQKPNNKFELWDINEFKKIRNIKLKDDFSNFIKIVDNIIFYEHNKIGEKYSIAAFNLKNDNHILLPVTIPINSFEVNKDFFAYKTNNGIVLYDRNNIKTIRLIDNYIKKNESLWNMILYDNNILFYKTNESTYLYDCKNLKEICSFEGENLQHEFCCDSLIIIKQLNNYKVWDYKNCKMITNHPTAEAMNIFKRTFQADKYTISLKNRLYIYNAHNLIGSIHHTLNQYNTMVVNSKNRIMESVQENSIVCYNTKINNPVFYSNVNSVNYNRNLNQLVTFNEFSKKIEIWDMKTNQIINSFIPKNKYTTHCILSNDGEYVAITDYLNAPIQFWKLWPRPELVKEIPLDNDIETFVNKMNFNKETTLIRSSNKIYNKPKGDIKREVLLFFNVNKLNSINDNNIEYNLHISFSLGGFDRTLFFQISFDIKTGEYKENKAKYLAEKYYLILQYGSFVVYDTENDKKVVKLKDNTSDIQYCKVSPNNKLFASGDLDQIIIWDLNNFSIKNTLNVKGEINCFEFSNDNKYLFVAFKEGTVSCFDLEYNSKQFTLRDIGADPEIFLANNDERLIVHSNNEVLFYDIPDIFRKLQFNTDDEILKMEKLLNLRMEGIELVPPVNKKTNLYHPVY